MGLRHPQGDFPHLLIHPSTLIQSSSPIHPSTIIHSFIQRGGCIPNGNMDVEARQCLDLGPSLMIQ